MARRRYALFTGLWRPFLLPDGRPPGMQSRLPCGQRPAGALAEPRDLPDRRAGLRHWPQLRGDMATVEALPVERPASALHVVRTLPHAPRRNRPRIVALAGNRYR